MTRHGNDLQPVVEASPADARPIPDMGQGSREQSCRTQSFRGSGIGLRAVEDRSDA
jgi:hypothetical protein